MKTINAVLATVVIGLATVPALAEGPPAGAGDRGKPSGIECQRAGISTLQALGLLAAVAKGGIEVVGAGMLDFQTVLQLHRTNPELFAGGDDAVTVVVPGVGEVVADWCD